MSARISRAMMTLAARCLGDRRREWAWAMQAEFEEAVRDGHALGFAIGCLAGAWRELPAQREGRLILASYALALGVIVPVAALLSSAAMLGFPYIDFGRTGLSAVLQGGEGLFLLNDGSRVAAPSLTLLVLLVAGTHLLIAWRMLDRDWERVAALGRLGLATTATLALVNGLAALDTTRLLPPIAAFVVELAAVSTLAWWHEHMSDASGAWA